METPLQYSCLPLPTKTGITEATRPLANFHESVWGDYFLAFASTPMETDAKVLEQQFDNLKEAVRTMIASAAANNNKKPWEEIELIDAIQRLGVAYHFENEIDEALKRIHQAYCQYDLVKSDNNNLCLLSILFRLLRQHGYYVSCDVFERFMDDKGKFKESLTSDVLGMLSLYEAAYMGVHGENILDEAIIFTTSQLSSMVPKLEADLVARVTHSLYQTIRRGLTRLEARHFISFYEKQNFHIEVLLDFAKLDFNLLQKQHQRELGEITRWWIDLDFKNKLPFARDRLVECYFWIAGVYFEPKYALGRKMLTRVIIMVTVLDDIYDAYGTLEELVLFNDAIQRWDISAINQLPEYMKLAYRALLDVYFMMEEEMAKQGRSYSVHYAKETIKITSTAYLDEAKWREKGYIPTFEEYMEVAKNSAGQTMLATNAFVGMGNLANKDVFDWIFNEPLLVRAVQIICRLVDDIVGHKFEQERPHVASAVECYMKQHSVSEEEAAFKLKKKVENAWKDVNAECLNPTTVPMPFLTRILNLARVIDVLYSKDRDCYTFSGAKHKEFATLLFVEPLPI